MKKIVISLIAMVAIIAMAYILKDIETTESVASSNRIIKISDEGSYEIWCDKKTKVLYLQSNQGSGYQGYGGLTVMLNTDGKPLLYKESEWYKWQTFIARKKK